VTAKVVIALPIWDAVVPAHSRRKAALDRSGVTSARSLTLTNITALI
jgi:hypothetical protein